MVGIKWDDTMHAFNSATITNIADIVKSPIYGSLNVQSQQNNVSLPWDSFNIRHLENRSIGFESPKDHPFFTSTSTLNAYNNTMSQQEAS